MTLPDTLRGRMDELLNRLSTAALAVGRREVVRRHGDSYMACCPAHDDKNPSLSLTLEPHRILLHCFAGCEPEDVATSVGMPMEALFDDYRGEAERQPVIRWNGASKDAEAALARDWREDAYGSLRAVSELDDGPKPLPPTLREFLDLDFPAMEPLLGPITTQQLVMLFAPPGAGKTMLALGLAHALAAGQDFLGWASARRARVLYIDGEMAGDEVQQRMARAAEAVEDDWLRMANLANWADDEGYEPINLCAAAGQDVVAVWAEATAAEVVVFDNLMSLAWVDGLSMSSDEFWQPVRRYVSHLRSKGLTVVIVDHTNAAGEIFGTKTKLWHANLAIRLTSIGGDEDAMCPTSRVRVTFEKVRGTVGQMHSEKVVTLGPVGQDWRHTMGRAEQRRMAREMKENGLSIRDIADEIGIPKSTVARWLK